MMLIDITLKMSSPCCAMVYPASGPPRSKIAFFLSSSSMQLIINVAGVRIECGNVTVRG